MRCAALQGVGLLIANEPVNGHLKVLAPIVGGPADRAGIRSGDEVVSIDGQVSCSVQGAMALAACLTTTCDCRFFPML